MVRIQYAPGSPLSERVPSKATELKGVMIHLLKGDYSDKQHLSPFSYKVTFSKERELAT